jgi:hypothetical protein
LFGFIYKSAHYKESPVELTCRRLLRLIHRSFIDDGWKSYEVSNHHVKISTDALFEKNGLVLGLVCSGSDRKMKSTTVSDLHRTLNRTQIYAVIVHSDPPDSSIIAVLPNYSVSLMHSSQLNNISDFLPQLCPKVTGSIDRITSQAKIHGWAKLSPTAERARLLPTLYDCKFEVVVANTHRTDLKRLGDGNYGFCIRLHSKYSPEQIRDDLIIGVLHGDKMISRLRPGPNTTLS